MKLTVIRKVLWVLLASYVTVDGAEVAYFSFSSSHYLVMENAGTAAVQIVRAGSTNTAASISLVTSNESAQAGLDYVYTSVRLDFSPGETNKTVFIPILDDTVGEGNERLYLNLFEPSTNAFVWNAWASLTIIDNEDVFSFSATNYVIDEVNTNLVVTVIRTGTPSMSPIVLLYSTTNGTAIPGVNYSSVNGYLIFQPPSMIEVFSIPILEDRIVESNATFFLRLSLGYGSTAMITTSNATVTIIDNDRPRLSILGQPTNEFRVQFTGEIATNYTIEVTTNLIHWSPWFGITNFSGVTALNDIAATNHPMRFYRAVVTP